MKHFTYVLPEKRSRLVTLLCITELCGIIIGSVSAVSSGNILPMRIISPFSCGCTLFQVFCGSLMLSAVFIIAEFLSGLFVFGQPFGLALMLTAGVQLGASAVSAFQCYGLSELPVLSIILVPEAAALSVTALLASREVMRSSTALLRAVALGDSISFDLRSYSLKFAVLSAILLLVSVAKPLLILILSDLL